MMVSARLVVERGPIHEPSQDWGSYLFVGLPSPGDRIMVDHLGTAQYLTVLCVHHRPTPVPEVEGMAPPAPPAADVVAKWTGSGTPGAGIKAP